MKVRFIPLLPKVLLTLPRTYPMLMPEKSISFIFYFPAAFLRIAYVLTLVLVVKPTELAGIYL
jgi:hypothetical protein